MEFANFKTVVKEEIERRIGEEYTVRVTSVVKNNGVVRNGVIIMRDDTNLCPTIYVDEFYELYENGDVSLNYVVNEIVDIYERNKSGKNIDISFFTDYNKVKNLIVFKLINTEKNRELLKDIPHVNFLDLSIIFQVAISEKTFGNAVITIHYAHMNLWDISIEELYQVAMTNTAMLRKYYINDMKNTLIDMLENGKTYTSNMVDYDKIEYIPMYILTNEMRVDGAGVILYQDILKDFASVIGVNLIIIPSSVHETIVLPEIGNENIDELKELIHEINRTQLLPDEILSDSVYYYNRDTDDITMI